MFAQYDEPPSGVHFVVPALQVVLHAPPEQTSPVAQVVPHVPQLALSLAMFAQYDEPPSGVHFVVPALQVVLHMPPEQTLPAAHATPQAPQLSGSFRVSVHAPAHSCWWAVQTPASAVVFSVLTSLPPPQPGTNPSIAAATTAVRRQTARKALSCSKLVMRFPPFPASRGGTRIRVRTT
jgi:hypothetical protein